MKQIKIIIERSKDFYSAYAENVKRISGGGETVLEAKQSVLECIETLKELDNAPKILQGEYELVYKFDTQSLLNHYKGIFTNSALERITGMYIVANRHYVFGLG